MAKTKNQKTEEMFRKHKTEPMFALVKKDNKIHVCVGGYAASAKTFDTFEQAEQYVNTKPWELIANVCAIILTKNKVYENNDKNPQDKQGGTNIYPTNN